PAGYLAPSEQMGEGGERCADSTPSSCSLDPACRVAQPSRRTEPDRRSPRFRRRSMISVHQDDGCDRSVGQVCARTLRLIRAWGDGLVLRLDPGGFALVMATGIVSNALFLHGRRETSDVLFAVNLVAYPWLWLLTALRAIRFGASLRADLVDPRR